MFQKYRIRLFYIGLVLLALNCIWSSICYHLYRETWNFDPGHAVPVGFYTTVIAMALAMCRRGWKRLPLAALALLDALFWWAFGMMAAW
jgi:hypothetical protein